MGAPSPLNTLPLLLENRLVRYSTALFNKPVDYVLFGVSGAWWFITSLPSATSQSTFLERTIQTPRILVASGPSAYGLGLL